MIRILTFAIAGPPIAPLLVWLIGMPILILVETGRWEGPAFSVAFLSAGLSYYTAMIPILLLCLAHWLMSRRHIAHRSLWCALIAFFYFGVFAYLRAPVSGKIGWALTWGLSEAIAAATCAWLTDKQYEASQATPQIKAGH